MKKQILKNLFSNYLANFLGLLLGFLLVPFLILKIGKEAYGVVILAESLIALFEIAAVSIRMSVARHATFTLARQDREGFLELMSTGQALFLVSSGFVLFLGCMISFAFPHIFRVPALVAGQSQILFLFITLSFTISILNMVHWVVLYTRHRYDLISFSTSLGVIVRALAIFGLFTFLPSKYVTIGTYGLAYLLMGITQNLSVYLWNLKIAPGLNLSFSYFRRERVKEILSYSAYVSISQTSTLLYQNTPNVLINLLWGPASNAIYSIAVRLPSIMMRLFQDATWGLTSIFNELVAQKDTKKIRDLYYLYTTTLVEIITPMAFFLTIFAKPVLRLWVGPEFDASAELVPYLVLPLLSQLPLCISGCLNNSYAKVKVPSLVSLTFAVLNIALGVILGKFAGMGLPGIALGSAICLVFYSLFFSPYYACGVAKIPLRDYLTKAFIVPLAICSFASALPFLWIRHLADSNQIPLAVISALAFVPAYAALGYFVIFNPGQRRQMRSVLKMVFPNLPVDAPPAFAKPQPRPQAQKDFLKPLQGVKP